MKPRHAGAAVIAWVTAACFGVVSSAERAAEPPSPIGPFNFDDVRAEFQAMKVLLDATQPGKARGAAACRLGKSRNPDYLPVLRDAAKDADAKVRADAVHAIGWIYGKCDGVCPMVFVRAMADPNDLVSLIGFTYGGAFARLPEEALPVLLDTMKRKDASLRSNAACELSRFGAAARQALPLLEKAIHDSDVWVRHNAALAIWRIAHDADGVLLVYVSHSQPEFQGTAFQAARHVIHLMVAEDAGATSGALLRLLIDPSPETRLKTCRAIASVVDKCKNCRSSLRMMHLSEALRQRLEDKDPEVRNAAADALFRLEQ